VARGGAGPGHRRGGLAVGGRPPGGVRTAERGPAGAVLLLPGAVELPHDRRRVGAEPVGAGAGVHGAAGGGVPGETQDPGAENTRAPPQRAGAGGVPGGVVRVRRETRVARRGPSRPRGPHGGGGGPHGCRQDDPGQLDPAAVRPHPGSGVARRGGPAGAALAHRPRRGGVRASGPLPVQRHPVRQRGPGRGGPRARPGGPPGGSAGNGRGAAPPGLPHRGGRAGAGPFRRAAAASRLGPSPRPGPPDPHPGRRPQQRGRAHGGGDLEGAAVGAGLPDRFPHLPQALRPAGSGLDRGPGPGTAGRGGNAPGPPAPGGLYAELYEQQRLREALESEAP
jgi:hypothetical protein